MEFGAAAEVHDALFGHLAFCVSVGSDCAGVSCSYPLLGGQAKRVTIVVVPFPVAQWSVVLACRGALRVLCFFLRRDRFGVAMVL